MSVRIGHASIDENRKIKGGSLGDQNGKEVCTRAWYDGNWGFLARAKAESVAQAMAAACEAGCANANIGYDQSKRNTLDRKARAVGYDLSCIDGPCATDCSAFVSVCVRAAGVDLPDSGGNAPTTSTLKNALTKTGAFTIHTDAAHLKESTYLRRGDILVRPGKHTVMVLDDGPGALAQLHLPVLERGAKGETVRAMQLLMMGRGADCGESDADGSFGPATQKAVKTFQKKNTLPQTGRADRETWEKLLGLR